MANLREKLGLRQVVTITPGLSAEDWDLYTSVEGVHQAALQLNIVLSDFVNNGASREDTAAAMHARMRQLSDFGADDTEPFAVLETVLNLIYGRVR